MSETPTGPVTVYTAPCPTCGADAPWHAKQFTEPTPKCRRCPALTSSLQDLTSGES